MFIKILKSNGKLKGRMTLGEAKIQIAGVSRLPKGAYSNSKDSSIGKQKRTKWRKHNLENLFFFKHKGWGRAVRVAIAREHCHLAAKETETHHTGRKHSLLLFGEQL